MRRDPTWYNNTWEAVIGSLEAGAIYSSNYKQVYKSTAPTARRWFSRFMLGKKRRMIVVRSQDEALTVYQLLSIGEIAKEDWSKSISEKEKKELESTIAFATIASFVSFKGGEVPLIVIEGMNMLWK